MVNDCPFLLSNALEVVQQFHTVKMLLLLLLQGLAPIHLAAIHGRVECLRLLVEKFKMDVNLGSTTGMCTTQLNT